MNRWHIYFIMGTSGSWKWTLRKNLENEKFESIDFLKSYVSRPKRPWEIDGDVYHFISKEEFLKWVDEWVFLEYAFVHKKDYYWTKKKDVIENWVNKWKKVIKELDMNGLILLKEKYPELSNDYTSIFLDLPIEQFKERIESRWVDMWEQEYNNRAESLEAERKEAVNNCDYIIDATLSPEEVLEKIKKIIL